MFSQPGYCVNVNQKLVVVNNEFPIWSGLTQFEVDSLNLIKSNQNSGRTTASSLLRLYLIASGDVRTQYQFDLIQQKLRDWTNLNKSEINGQASLWEKAYILHRLMHNDFLSESPTTTDIAKGYDHEQSQLSKVFQSKQYNCISASLLYAFLASEFNLKISGVLLPSHVFIQLELAKGQLVEVETTSDAGFDWVHDEQFYQQEQSADWFSQRGLTPSTFIDYQNREIVSALQLGIQNMRNQHVQSSRMGYIDRMRLAELMSYLSPDDLKAHKQRISFYTKEYSQLREQNDFNSLQNLFSKVMPYFEQLRYNNVADLELKNMLGWMYSQAAIVAINTNNDKLAVNIIQDNFQSLEPQIEDFVKIKNNFYFVLSKVVEKIIERQQFVEAEVFLSQFSLDCEIEENCKILQRNLYSQWASYYWDLADWPAAINRYHKILVIEPSSDVTEVFRKNSQSAYLNWSNTKMIEGDWLGASEILKQCIGSSGLIVECEARLLQLRQKHQLQ